MPFYFCSNIINCWPIFTMLSPIDLVVNFIKDIPQFYLKLTWSDARYPTAVTVTSILTLSVMLIISLFMIFAVFDPWQLTQWINCRFIIYHYTRERQSGAFAIEMAVEIVGITNEITDVGCLIAWSKRTSQTSGLMQRLIHQCPSHYLVSNVFSLAE